MNQKLSFFLSPSETDMISFSESKINNENVVEKIYNSHHNHTNTLKNLLFGNSDDKDEKYYPGALFNEENYGLLCDKYEKMSVLNAALFLNKTSHVALPNYELKLVYDRACDLLIELSMIENMMDIGFEYYHVDNLMEKKQLVSSLIDYCKNEFGDCKDNYNETRRIEKIKKILNNGEVNIVSYGYIGCSSLKIVFENKNVKIIKNGFGFVKAENEIYENFSNKEIRILLYLIYKLKSKGFYGIEFDVYDSGTLKIDILQNGRKIHSCSAYHHRPRDMDVLSEYVTYITSDEEKYHYIQHEVF